MKKLMSSDTNTVRGMDSESIKKYLFKMAMKSRWEEVVQAYGQNERAHNARITRSGDTALHIAVSDCQEKWVEELVKLVSTKELGIQNERGNTPLHLAAAMGNVRMCDCIAKKDKALVGIPNKDKETPLFLAALQGQKDAFLCLHYICAPVQSQQILYSYCRREDGDTVLHCAIAGEYFDLAFQIIALYKDLVNSVNDVGFTPLHLLASMPFAFKSGSLLRRWNVIIYHCIYVDKLKVEQSYHFREREKERGLGYLENYKSFINIMRVFRRITKALASKENVDERRGRKESTDAENPNEPKVDSLRDQYNTCFDFVKLLSKVMLIVLGLGSKGIKKIRDKKEKHIWAVQIMDELITRAEMYEYEDSGMNPYKDDETMPYEELSMTHRPSNTDYQQKDNNQKNQKNGEGSSLQKVTEKKTSEMAKKETPILIIASKNGVTEETVQKILDLFPVAIHDLNAEKKNMPKRESPILIAAKNGVTEMVQKILDLFPVAINDLNAERKNIVLLAVENDIDI